MRTTDPAFFTIVVLPHDAARRGITNALTDTPSLRFVVEGSNVLGLRAEQIVITSGCDLYSNEFRAWFNDLKTRLKPGGRVVEL